MNHSLRLLITASTLIILTACGNNSSGTSTDTVAAGQSSASSSASSTSATSSAPSVQLVQSVDAYRPPASTAAQESPMKARDLSAAPSATSISLGAPLASQAAAARKNNATVGDDHMGKPLQIGFGRTVPQTASAAATQQVLKWQATKTGGQVAAINFSSTGAKGIRIGLLVTKLPETATLRFYSKGAATAFEVKGSEVLAVLAKNLAAGDKTDEARTYWGPVIDGSNGTVEIEIPDGVQTSSVDVAMPSVTHLFMSTKESSTAISQLTYAGDYNAGLSCQVDVKCTTPLPAASDAVAHLRFNKNGGTYICSGTLLNDSISSGTPYLLTANHCISDQTVASTLQTWFKYRALTCNDGTTGEYYPTATTGAALLYTAYATDSTLVGLYGTPSVAGVLYAGWDSTAQTTTTTVHNIHHPKGDQQRLSRGSVTGHYTRSATNPNSFSGSNITSGTILEATLTTGLTEPGSSGSGLFKGADTNPQVIGQLFGGPTPACGVNPTNVYGRFDVAYTAGMSDWLTQGLKPVYRFYNNLRGTHFFSLSVTEKNFIQANYPQFSFENAAFSAYSNADAATRSPVYRFYNSSTQSHFFTIDVAEKDAIVAKINAGIWPQFAFEGASWYAKTAAQFASAPNGTIPLYRFYRTNGTHFYTVNAAEKASIIANLSAYYTYEGIAYYVWP